MVEDAGQPTYRGQQLFHALVRRAGEFRSIRFRPCRRTFARRWSRRAFRWACPRFRRSLFLPTGRCATLIELADHETVETVWMPEGDGGEAGDGTKPVRKLRAHKPRGWRRATICISSQVGCAVNCQFCLTALLGIKRNLSAGEIVGQVIAVLQDQKVAPPDERVNLVFMGMGEPFLNYRQLHQGHAAAGGGSRNSGIADDGFDGGNRSANLRSGQGTGAAETGDFAHRAERHSFAAS